MAPPLRRVSIHGYRAARELELTPGSVCALVGEASSGKSTVLTAIWTLLEAAAPPPTIDDVVLHPPLQRFLRRWQPGDPAVYLGALWAP